MGNFYTDVICADSRTVLTTRIADLGLLEPVTRLAVQDILEDLGPTWMVFETCRSRHRQEYLFSIGATHLRKVGVHQYGLAADIIRRIDGEPSWKGDFTPLRLAAVRHGLISGQDWGQPGMHHDFIDADHVQRVSLADQSRLFDGTWYPDESYKPCDSQ